MYLFVSVVNKQLPLLKFQPSQLHRWIKKFSKFSFMMCGVQQLCISPFGAQFTKMAANGEELTCYRQFGTNSIFVLMFVESQKVYIQSTCKVCHKNWECCSINLLKPNDIYICRTAALTSRRYILNIYSTNIHTEYFKHAA